MRLLRVCRPRSRRPPGIGFRYPKVQRQYQSRRLNWASHTSSIALVPEGPTSVPEPRLVLRIAYQGIAYQLHRALGYLRTGHRIHE
eukprot:2647118-Rhodomonas_salina.1